MILGEAMNTHPIALLEIKKRGYLVSAVYHEESDDMSWFARKDDMSIEAFNPLSLLALVVITDTYGEKWNQTTTSDFYNQLIENS